MKTEMIKRELLLLVMIISLSSCDALFRRDYPPVCTIVTPVNAEEYDFGAPISITISASDPNNDLSHINLYLNSLLLETFYQPPYSYTISGGEIETGIFIIRAEAIDNKGNSSTNTVTISVVDNFVMVAGGSFTQGKYYDESTSSMVDRTVTLSSFMISRYEITNQQFCRFLNDAKCGFDAELNGKKMIYYKELTKSGEYPVTDKIVFADGRFVPVPGYEKHPVTAVTWYGANEYCKFYGGTLPTVAQWLFAASGGNFSQAYIYAGSSTIETIGWYSGNSATLKAIGQKLPNELGLFDMTGNASEWVFDFTGTYTQPEAHDPQQPDLFTGDSNSIVGGSFTNGPEFMILSTHPREGRAPGVPSLSTGFRMVKPAIK